MLVGQRYRLSEVIGRGAMGEVWRAVDDVLGRCVAVKLVNPRLIGNNRAVERFQREAKAASMVGDPHVVAIFDFGSHDDGQFLVMELVEGRSIAAELMNSGLMDPDRAATIVAQVSEGLAAAHDRGVVHRDIKPGNLLLTDDGTVKIVDFGIARLVSDSTAVLTATGEIAGTCPYLAPERALGQAGDPPADIYALGCVLYEMVCGRPPFHGDVPAAIAYQHVEVAPIPPSELRPELAGPFEDFLLRMLAKRPQDRPTAEEVAAWGSGTPMSVTHSAIVHPRRRPSRPVALFGSAAVTTITALAAVLLQPGSGSAPSAQRPAAGPSATAPAQVVPTPQALTRRQVPVGPTTARPTASAIRPSTGQPAAARSNANRPSAGTKPERAPKAAKRTSKSTAKANLGRKQDRREEAPKRPSSAHTPPTAGQRRP